MALTNATIEGAWTLQSTNTALEGRLQVGGLWAQANVQNTALTPMQVWRQGVVSAASYSANSYDFVVAQTSSPSLSLLVYPGTFIVGRASQAVYQGYSTAVQTVTVAAADPTNPRLDLIVARVEDTGIGDANLRAQVQVITGTPAPSPVIPALPTGAIPLASARVNALATTITSANLVDLRKSTALNGAVRRLLPGDSLSDPGFRDGELRDTGTTIDRWVDSTSTWLTVSLIGVGAGFARYTNNGTGLLTVASNGDVIVPFNNPVSTSTYITASGTNNNTFTINRSGKCTYSAGIRWKTDATLGGGGDWWFRAVLAGTTELGGETEKASVGYGINTFFVKSFSATRSFNAGDQLSFRFANTATGQSSSMVNSAENIFCSFLWGGP